MRKIICLSFVLVSATLSAQEQQLGNVFVNNNNNPPVQLLQTNLINTLNINDDNNLGNQMIQQGNFNEENQNKAQSIQSDNNAQRSNSINSNGVSFNFSFSRSSSAASSNAKSHRHTFSKKLKKFERNFYGKMAMHKKSKHLVDVCFNWTK